MYNRHRKNTETKLQMKNTNKPNKKESVKYIAIFFLLAYHVC